MNKRKLGFDVENQKGKSKPVDSRGNAKLRETGVPGAPAIGTPKYIKAAVNAAEGRKDFNTSEHRDRGHQAGTGGIRKGLFGESEKIRGGQSSSANRESE